MTDTDHTDPLNRLAKLVESIDIAMLTTSGGAGRLESRPMATQDVDPAGFVWFFASRSSHLRASVEASAPVNIAYSGKGSYVSVTGRATVVDDRQRRHQFWRDAYKAWFPGGVDDPDLILIRVEIDYADYWEAPGNVVTRLAGFAKAALTGKAPGGTHGHLEI